MDFNENKYLKDLITTLKEEINLLRNEMDSKDKIIEIVIKDKFVVKSSETNSDLIFISQSIIPNFRDFWVGDDHGSDHFIINGVFSYTLIYNKMNEKTVRLFHKANWIDINFSIRTTMTKTTLNKRNVTEDEIDNYVDTLTNTITSVIAEKVPTKSIKRNSMGLPIEIRELIRQKRHQWRLSQKTRVPQYKTNANRLQKRISKDITTRKRDS